VHGLEDYSAVVQWQLATICFRPESTKFVVRGVLCFVNSPDHKARGFLLRRQNFHRHTGRQSGSRLHRRSPALGRFGPSPTYRVRLAFLNAPFRTPGVCATPVLTSDRAARPISSEYRDERTITRTRFPLGVKPRDTLAVFTVASAAPASSTSTYDFKQLSLSRTERMGFEINYTIFENIYIRSCANE
jgi:hypothetical protein